MGAAASQLLSTTATAAQLLPTTTADAATTTVPDTCCKKTRQRRGYCGARLLNLCYRAVHPGGFYRVSRIRGWGRLRRHRLATPANSGVRAAYYRRREALNAR